MLNTLGKTDRFIRGVAEVKSKTTSGITPDDKRGKKIPPHALSNANKAEAVQKHIASFPAYVSHYCRSKTNETKYLRSDLTVADMYRLYQQEPDNPPVSLSTYTKQFKLTGLKIHPPQTDGCDTCDALDISMKGAGDDLQRSLKIEKEMHLRRAEKAYELKKKAKAAAKQDPTSRVLVMDLQQCLPQHLILNARRCITPVNSMSSTLQFMIAPQASPTAICGVRLRNRNSTICMTNFIVLQEHPSIQEINHIFLIPGHTFMPEVDGKHAVIEKYKKRLEKINVPDEWYTAVKQAGMTDPTNFPDGKFKVTHVTSFYDVASLAKEELVRRKKCTDKEPLNYLDTHWWKYSRNNIGMVHVKSSFSEEAEFRTLSFLRRGVRADRLPPLLPCLQALPAVRPISEQKKKDLISLLCYLNKEFHSFYHNLPVSGSAQELHPDSPLMAEEDEDDPTD
ncbi:Lon protease-like protein, mitochondrial [Frankliniella fusca]|uniref:Lon protease-like protein, mitochondrial n=1 Tax=Frankliniella fusca TaxID=407009 RepID=A0AAE1GQK2_9NEOP|nr:Lon protease-like protein, mitochondrial [Frankliniella fusca]